MKHNCACRPRTSAASAIRRECALISFVVAMLSPMYGAAWGQAKSNAQVLTGLPTGVVMHLAGADGDPLALAGAGHLVLCIVPTTREAALTATVENAGRTGQVVVVAADSLKHLPVADRLARAVVAENWPEAEKAGLTSNELLRVVAPFGEVIVRDSANLPKLEPFRTEDGWRRWRRTLPPEMGEWTINIAAEHGMSGITPDGLDGKVTNIGTVLRLFGDGYPGGSRLREPLRQALWPRFIVGNNRSRGGTNVASFAVAGGRLFAFQAIDTTGAFAGDAVCHPPLGALVARDAASGLLHWSQPGMTQVLAADADVLLVTGGKGIRALDPATGNERWTAPFTTRKGTPPNLIPVGNGEVILGGDGVRRLRRDGTIRWTTDVTGRVALAAGRLTVDSSTKQELKNGSKAGSLTSLDSETGAVRWSVLPADRTMAILSCMDERHIVLDDGLSIEVRSVNDGRIVLTRDRAKTSINSGRGGELSLGNYARLWQGHLVFSLTATDARGKTVWKTTVLSLPEGKEVMAPNEHVDGLGMWACNGGGTWTHGTIRGIVESIAHPQVTPAGSYAAGGTCGTVNPVAYNTVYQTPLNCECLSFTHNVRGFLALAPPTAPPGTAWTKPATPERGPGAGDPTPATGWTMFRGNPQRSSHSTEPLGHLVSAWHTSPALSVQAPFQAHDNRQRSTFNGPISAPVVTRDLVLAALPESRAIVAIGTDGKQRWRTIVGGAADTPPTLTRGLAICGTSDGRVQALSLADGRLVWRVRITPMDERIIAHGHFQDRFPASGSVVLEGRRVHATAGISGEIGIQYAALEVDTGDIRDYRLLPLGGYLHDVLVADQRGSLFLGPIPVEESAAAAATAAAQSAFDTLEKVKPGRPPVFSLPRINFGSISFDNSKGPLDRLLPIGEPLCAIGRTVAYDTGIRRTSKFGGMLWGQAFAGRQALLWAWNHKMQVGVIQQLKVARGMDGNDLPLGDSISCFPIHTAEPKDKVPLPAAVWSVPTDRVWALAIVGEKVLAAGPVRTDLALDPRRSKGQLLVLSMQDGSIMQTLPLPKPPVQDGIAVAHGLVVLTLWDGSVIAFSSTKP